MRSEQGAVGLVGRKRVAERLPQASLASTIGKTEQQQGDQDHRHKARVRSSSASAAEGASQGSITSDLAGCQPSGLGRCDRSFAAASAGAVRVRLPSACVLRASETDLTIAEHQHIAVGECDRVSR